MNKTSNFGELLLEARTRKGLTRKAVADASGVHESNVYNWEMRGMTPRSFASLAAAAQAVGLRPRQIV